MSALKGENTGEPGSFWGAGAPQEGGTGSWKAAKISSPGSSRSCTPSPMSIAVVDYGQAGNGHTTCAVVDKGPTVQEPGPVSLFQSQETVVAEEEESDTPELWSDSDSDRESDADESSKMPDLVASEGEESESDVGERLASETEYKRTRLYHRSCV